MKIGTALLTGILFLNTPAPVYSAPLNILSRIVYSLAEDRGPKRVGTGKRASETSESLPDDSESLLGSSQWNQEEGNLKDQSQENTDTVQEESSELPSMVDRAMFKAIPKGTADSRTPRRVIKNGSGIPINDASQQPGLRPKARIEEDGSVVYEINIPSKKDAGSSKFQPEVIRIRVGEFVEWSNQDERSHFVNKKPSLYKAFSSYDNEEEEESDDPEDIFNSTVLRPGVNWKKQFTTKGTIQYYCFTHPQEMNGIIVVE